MEDECDGLVKDDSEFAIWLRVAYRQYRRGNPVHAVTFLNYAIDQIRAIESRAEYEKTGQRE